MFVRFTGCRFFGGSEVKRLAHHKKPAPPSNEIRITPTITILTTNLTASLAMRTNTAASTMPPIIKIVVLLMGGECQSRLLVTGTNDRFYISSHVKIAFELNTQRITGTYEVIEDHVHDVLVKDLYIPK